MSPQAVHRGMTSRCSRAASQNGRDTSGPSGLGTGFLYSPLNQDLQSPIR